MTVSSFLDTNVLLYAGSNAPQDAVKKARALRLIRRAPFAISAQVLQEFVANALTKKSLGLSEANIVATIQNLRDVPTQPITRELVGQAWHLRQRFQISHWDAALLAAAQELGCETLYSEDFTHGQRYGSVTVINPFLEESV